MYQSTVNTELTAKTVHYLRFLKENIKVPFYKYFIDIILHSTLLYTQR